MYPPELVRPMREELSTKGFKELHTAEEVDSVMHIQDGTVLVMVNSVCGCAAGAARPGILKAIGTSAKLPNHITTVFAGVDREAVDKARAYMAPYPPSSPLSGGLAPPVPLPYSAEAPFFSAFLRPA